MLSAEYVANLNAKVLEFVGTRPAPALGGRKARGSEYRLGEPRRSRPGHLSPAQSASPARLSLRRLRIQPGGRGGFQAAGNRSSKSEVLRIPPDQNGGEDSRHVFTR